MRFIHSVSRKLGFGEGRMDQITEILQYPVNFVTSLQFSNATLILQKL